MKKVFCNICFSSIKLRKDGTIRSHHPPFNGIGTLECRGSYSKNFSLCLLPEITKKKRIKKKNRFGRLSAEDFRRIQKNEFAEFRLYNQM